jgi:hypothetical protein
MARGKKQTSPRVSTIAGKYLGDVSIIDPDLIADCVRGCGVPLNDRAVLVLTNKIETALAPLCDDVRSLAASCVAQDERKGQGAPKAWTSIMGTDPAADMAERLDAGDDAEA